MDVNPETVIDEEDEDEYSAASSNFDVDNMKYGTSGTCHICSKSLRCLKKHLESVHFQSPIACPICGKMLKSKHRLGNHKNQMHPSDAGNATRVKGSDPINQRRMFVSADVFFKALRNKNCKGRRLNLNKRTK